MRISNSGIQCFKSCRRMYELKYVEGLIPVQTADVLERGRSYHSKIEALLKGEQFEFTDPKTDAMALAFQWHLMPNIGKVEAVEEWFHKELPDGNVIIGRCDGRLQDGRLVEHKTTSSDLDEAYIAGLQNDEQILTYMWAYGVNNILYTVCKAPTIRPRKDETEEEFRDRCLDWYNTDTQFKIGTIDVYRPQEEIDEFANDLLKMSDEITNCHNFYRVPSHCVKWGRPCEYMGVCRNYDPYLEYIGFTKEGKA